MNRSWGSISKAWVEYWGRRRRAVPVEFPDGEIILRVGGFAVSPLTEAVYLNLAANIYAVITTPEGESFNIKGGYNELRSGRYELQYIDKHDRAANLPPIAETTLDGAIVSFTVYIRYRVTNPLTLLEIDQPLLTLFAVIESDVKEYIRTHNHDEIIDVHTEVASNHLAHFISQEYNRHAMISKAIALIDIGVKDRHGDESLIDLRKTIQVQQKQNQTDSELLAQKQALERRVAEQDADIKQINADSQARLKDTLAAVQRKDIELENERRYYQLKQERSLKALETISQALSSSGYQRSQAEMTVIQNLVNALKEEEAAQAVSPAPVPARPEAGIKGTAMTGVDRNAQTIDDLTNTLLNLVKGRNSSNTGGG